MKQTILQKYAQVLIQVGINVQAGDCIQITGDTDSLELIREVVRAAWQAGARDVKTRLTDKAFDLAYYEEARDEDLDYFPAFEADYQEAMLKVPYHRVYVSSPSLDLLAHIDQARIQRSQKAALTATRHLDKYMDTGEVKWVVAACPSPRWAKAVFPDLEKEEALDRLWQVVLSICRVDQADPVAAWKAHDASLKAREAWLDQHDFDYLHFQGPDTDLTVHLAQGHKWIGGSSATPQGIDYMANIPTEELFTTPHALKVEGRIRSTKPLSVMGKIVDDFGFTFKEGKVVDFFAGQNPEVLETLLNMDEGARRLGEVALVPHSSPVSQSGLLFKSTLFDENASCHFALGMAYAEAIHGGAGMTAEERQALGSNDSMIHIDFMVGGPDLDISGVTKDGQRLAILSQGEWAF